MKQLTLTLKHANRIPKEKRMVYLPTECHAITFEDPSGASEILASEEIDKGGYLRVGDALHMFCFLMTVTALKQEISSSANEVDDNEVVTKMICDKLYNVAVRKKSPGWLFKLFGEHPKGKYLIVQDKTVKFSNGEDGGEQISIRIKNKETKKDLTQDELNIFYQRFIAPKEEDHLHKVFIKVDLVRKDGTSVWITNDGHIHHIAWKDSFILELSSNYPDYFCVFWIDGKAGVYELYPDIKSDLKKQHYKSEYNRDESKGSSKLKIPSNDTISIDSHRGVENCIFFTSNEPFKREEVNKMKSRLRILMEGDVYCRSPKEYDYDEKYLEEEDRASVEHIVEIDLEATLSTEEWRGKIVDQMHGFASKIYFLQLAHLSRGL